MVMERKIVNSIFYGIGVGVIVLVFYLLLTERGGVEVIATVEVIKQLIGMTLLGAYMSVLSLIFQIEKWPLLYVTILHCILLSVGFLFTGIALNWFVITQAIGIFLTFFTIYIIIWFVLYYFNMRLVKKLNISHKKSCP